LTGRVSRNYAVVPMAPRHVLSAAAIERDATPSPWSETQIAAELAKPSALFFVLEEEGAVLGFGGIWLVGAEAQLAEMAVRRDRRRQGVGRALLDALLRRAKEDGARAMTLEVREGNAAARALYASAGFRETSRRPHFYEGRETAVLMGKNL